MRFIVCVLASCAVLFLVGCANHSKDYLKKGGEIGTLVVPPGVPLIKQDTYYPVPVVAHAAPAKSISLKPPTLK